MMVKSDNVLSIMFWLLPLVSKKAYLFLSLGRGLGEGF